MSEPTSDSKVRMRDLHLAFGFDPTEEYVTLHATCGGTVYDLTSRTPKYELLVLARQRLADAALGLTEGECGWMPEEQLAFAPGRSVVNAAMWFRVWLYKIRFQFAELPVFDPDSIVECRPTEPPNIRIGTGHLTVAPLEQAKRD